MGTIGDLLGIDLAAAFAQDTSGTPDLPGAQAGSSAAPPLAEASPDALDPTSQPESGRHKVAADEEMLNPRHEAVLAALLAETQLDPSLARRDLSLSADLDLDTLGLYAVVAAIEHELHCTFTDETVCSWQTIDDILQAVDKTQESA